ncbi:hypothetical protein ABFA07_007100 [Porites harrisoni]
MSGTIATTYDFEMEKLYIGSGKKTKERRSVKMPIIMAGENQEVPLSDIYMAKMRIEKDFKATPCTKASFGYDFGIEVALKEENLSPTGSYYDRAVLNSLLVLPEDQQRRGVITATESRPFIRALFHYGPKLGVPVTIVVPNGSKIQTQMCSQPGRVIVSCGADINEAKKNAKELAKGVRLEYIDRDDSSSMFAGLCTMGFEILEQYGSNVQAILVPGSENNLLKALKCSIKSISPQVQIIGVHMQDKEHTESTDSNFLDMINESDSVLQVNSEDVSKAVIRVVEEKGFLTLLSEEGVMALAALLSSPLTQLERVVVVCSECLVPSLLQIEQVLKAGLVA